MHSRKAKDKRYDDSRNLIKQFVPKEKPGDTNPRETNPLSNRDLQIEY